jgi:hypothetical protein
MTVNVTIRNRDASEILYIVCRLRAEGLVQGKDFDFAYHQSRWDGMIGEIPTSAIFTFYEEKYASLFSLKYGS